MHMPGNAGHDELDRAYFTRAAPGSPVPRPPKTGWQNGPDWYKLFSTRRTISIWRRIVGVQRYFRRILSPRKVYVGGAAALRTIICGAFIVMIALFCTSSEPRSAYDKPLPMPAELGLE
jgi:hypothetical protein